MCHAKDFNICVYIYILLTFWFGNYVTNWSLLISRHDLYFALLQSADCASGKGRTK